MRRGTKEGLLGLALVGAVGCEEWPPKSLDAGADCVARWVLETVNSSVRAEGNTSLALDEHGGVHIAYQDRRRWEALHATNSSGDWLLELIDTRVATGVSPSIALDPDGAVHIIYRDIDPPYLWHATNGSGEWVIDGVATRVDGTSLAVDADGAAHVSFHDQRDRDLRYATNASGEWVVETITPPGFAGGTSSIALDSAGRVHVAFVQVNVEPISVGYATNVGGAWAIETVDSADATWLPSLGVDSAGVPHVSYNARDDDELRHATKVPEGWARELVDADGTSSSLAVDAAGAVHIAYDAGQGRLDLRYATNDGGAWTIEEVDSEGDTGVSPSIGLHESGVVHVSYLDATNDHLRHASRPAEQDCVGEDR